MEERISPLRSVRKSFSVVGYAFALLIAVATTVKLAFLTLPEVMGWDGLTEQSWWTWVCASAPMYLFAFPACFLMLRILPGQAPEQRKLSLKQFLTLIPICFCMMYAGNLIGTFLSMLLSGGNAVNALNDYAMDDSPLKILVMVILAPLLEELICRKLLIDRIACYGEKLSVLMSGLIFGLLHQNLFQFFYAFALGSLFGYVYIRTGRLRYSVILHTGINFLGAVVAPAVLSLLNMDAINEVAEGTVSVELLLEILPGYTVLMTYATILLGVSVFGLVLLILKLRHLTWKETQFAFKPTLKASILNVGMIVYSVVCLLMIVLALFNI